MRNKYFVSHIITFPRPLANISNFALVLLVWFLLSFNFKSHVAYKKSELNIIRISSPRCNICSEAFCTYTFLYFNSSHKAISQAPALRACHFICQTPCVRKDGIQEGRPVINWGCRLYAPRDIWFLTLLLLFFLLQPYRPLVLSRNSATCT
jgi:hypothetical protein